MVIMLVLLLVAMMAPGGSNVMLSVRDLSERWGVSEKTVYKMYKAWGLPAVRIGRHVRFREREVKRYEDEHEASNG